MSLLGFMSVKLDRQQTLLEGLNEALLIVQSESLSRAADLGFTPEQIAAALTRILAGTRMAELTKTYQQNGALRAAAWVVGQKPGLYDMQDVLGLR